MCYYYVGRNMSRKVVVGKSAADVCGPLQNNFRSTRPCCIGRSFAWRWAKRGDARCEPRFAWYFLRPSHHHLPLPFSPGPASSPSLFLQPDSPCPTRVLSCQTHPRLFLPLTGAAVPLPWGNGGGVTELSFFLPVRVDILSVSIFLDGSYHTRDGGHGASMSQLALGAF